MTGNDFYKKFKRRKNNQVKNDLIIYVTFKPPYNLDLYFINTINNGHK